MISARVAKNMTCTVCLLTRGKMRKFGEHSLNELARCMAQLQTVYINDQQNPKELEDK